MANSLAWRVNEDPSEGESLEDFVDRITAAVILTELELKEIPDKVRISAAVFESEAENIAYFKRQRIVDKFLGWPTDPRIAARYKPSLAERSKEHIRQKSLEGRRTAEFTKVRDQLLAGLEPEYDSALLSDEEIEMLYTSVVPSIRKEREVASITHQLLENVENLEFDHSLISDEDLEEIRTVMATEKFQWLNSRVRPPGQPYGVSNYGAERLVADWLAYLGCKDVTLTQPSQDGGVDVETANHVCQVKYYKNQGVSVQEVREIFGVASAVGKGAMVFTSSDLTAAAYEFANQVGIIAVQFNVESSILVGLNYHGKKLLEEGEYE
jgi:hypothetical protein